MNRGLFIGGAAVALLVGSQLFIAPENTLIARLGQIGGEFEEQWVRERTEAVAEQNEALREAEARVQRETLAMQKAIEAEAQIAQNQATRIHQSSWVKMLGANIADFACGVGLLGEAQQPGSAQNLMEMCRAGDQIRGSMAEDYREALKDKRTTTMDEMMKTFRDAHGE